jgi:hypothetical protein
MPVNPKLRGALIVVPCVLAVQCTGQAGLDVVAISGSSSLTRPLAPDAPAQVRLVRHAWD